MKQNPGRLIWALLLSYTILAGPSYGQTRRVPATRAPARPVAKEPIPTFDTLLAADSYKVYSEVRGVGQLVRSAGVNDLLSPIMQLAGPPKEFRTVVKWLDAHADEIMTSRMLAASWPTRPGLPQFVCAIEFSSAEEARNFDLQLKGFLPKVLPAPTPSPSAQSSPLSPAQKNQAAPPAPNSPPPAPLYVIKHTGNLVLISDSAINVAKLRPAGSKLLSESQNFRLARDRFSSESLFVYFNVELEERSSAPTPTPEETVMTAAASTRVEPVVEPPPPDANSTPELVAEVQVATGDRPPGEVTAPQAVTAGPDNASSERGPHPDFAMVLDHLFSGRPTWPEAIGLAVSFEPESYVVRAFLVNAPENRSISIPFIPQLISGPAIAPAAPSVLPADTELLITASLDYRQIYEGIGKSLANENQSHRRTPEVIKDQAPVNPLATYERLLGINLKNELIPLLGNEIAVSLPLKALIGGPGRSAPTEEKPNAEGSVKEAAPSRSSPILLLEIKDRDPVRALIPKLMASVGLKGASQMAQTERRDDTELVSFANVISYAFISDFIVLSSDNAAVRHVVDSYLNHQTLASDTHFRNSTRWQPRQVLGQIYVSPAALETYNSFSPELTTSLSQKMVEFLMSLGPSSEAITYALSNEGLGPLHELHVPKRLIMMMVAGISGGAEQSRAGANESIAQSSLRTIVSAEATYQATTGNGKYGSLEELISNGLISKDIVEKYGYRIELLSSGTRFESSAVPVEYGKTGRNSFFVDESGVLRIGDHGGGPATVADRELQ